MVPAGPTRATATADAILYSLNIISATPTRDNGAAPRLHWSPTLPTLRPRLPQDAGVLGGKSAHVLHRPTTPTPAKREKQNPPHGQ